jgi:hypothetical protein
MSLEPTIAAPASRLPVIPGYRVLRRLGQGGMAEVYLVIQLSLQREIAVKVMAFDNAVSEELAGRFEREARTIARLDHPNVVGIHEVGRTRDGLLYYSMPYLPNGHLGERRLTGDVFAILRVMQQIGEALEYAHGQGVVHRDVKPENILFDKADRPLLTDFGIALDTGGNHRVTGRGKTLGSSAYMSPEQARDSEIDGRADLYSLGVVCYEMLTGDLPFHGSDALSMAIAHMEDPVPRLPRPVGAWQAFIDRALAKSPNDRFQTARELLGTLADVERRMQAPPPRAPVRAPLLIAAGIAAAFALAWWSAGRIGDPAASTAAPALTARVARVPVMDAAALDRELRAAHALIAQGKLVDPDDSAGARFLALLAQEPSLAEARAGLDASLAAAASLAEKHIAAARGAEAAVLYEKSYALAQRSTIPDYPAWADFERRFAAAVEAAMARAARRLDPGAATALGPAIDAAALHRPAIRNAAQALAALPTAGSALRDEGGPPLAIMPAGANGVPEHAFAIGVREVTRGEYAAFARAQGRAAAKCRDGRNVLSLLRSRSWREPGFPQGDDEPIVCVTAADARAYAAWLSQKTAQRYRLPTAVEWRQVAGGIGTGTTACKLGNVLGQEADMLRLSDRHDCRDRHAYTAPVGAYGAGPLGVQDLVGNVREWLGDCAKRAGSACARSHVAGSSWRDGERRPLTTTNAAEDDDVAQTDLGFRIVREFDPAHPPSAGAP